MDPHATEDNLLKDRKEDNETGSSSSKESSRSRRGCRVVIRLGLFAQVTNGFGTPYQRARPDRVRYRTECGMSPAAKQKSGGWWGCDFPVQISTS